MLMLLGLFFDFNVSRNNTAGSHTVVQNADALGTFIWRGDDGDEFVDAAAIECNVDGTPGNGDMPGRFVFYTSPDGTTGLQERLRITSKGALKARAGDSLATYASTTDHTHEIWQKEAGYGIIKLATAAGTTNQYGVMIDMADDITNTSNWFQRCLAGTDARFYIYSNGDVFTKTGTDIQQSSDRRLKDNITDYSGGLTVLKSLTPRTYTWKEGQGAAGTQYGFVAQEIEESSAVVDNMNLFSIVVPTRDDDKNPLQPDNKQYNTQLSSKDAIYISAIQELSAEIETLKAEVKTLKGE